MHFERQTIGGLASFGWGCSVVRWGGFLRRLISEPPFSYCHVRTPSPYKARYRLRLVMEITGFVKVSQILFLDQCASKFLNDFDGLISSFILPYWGPLSQDHRRARRWRLSLRNTQGTKKWPIFLPYPCPPASLAKARNQWTKKHLWITTPSSKLWIQQMAFVFPTRLVCFQRYAKVDPSIKLLM